MKDLYHLNPKAYKEGYEIIKSLPESTKKKIPEEIWEFIKENMDTNHEITWNHIYENSLLEDTNTMLAILYKAYLATEEEKIIIKAKENSIRKKKEKEAYKKYNPNNLFKK